MTWYKITIRPLESATDADRLDSICAELIECGASGTTLGSDSEIECFIQGDTADVVHLLIDRAQALGCEITSHEEVLEENWTAACPELWEPIKAGSFTILPVESSDDKRDVASDVLRIIPGLGFGTGHHPTTNMIIGVLSELTRTPPPTKVFDLGTGSGILAIAAAKLFQAPVIGVDIDPLAISNARENVALNGVESLVSVSTDPIEAIQETFPLIVANVYGEALAALSKEITRIAEPRCSLVLSGISELVCGLVLEAFCDALGWHLERELSQDGWVCLALQRG